MNKMIENENGLINKRELLKELIRKQASSIIIAPLSLAQGRLCFINKLKPDSSAYNLFRVFRISGDFNTRIFTQAVNVIVQRHGTLRTKFVYEKGEDLQVVVPFFGIDIPVFDFSNEPTDQIDERLNQLIIEDANTPFNLSSGDLFRVKIYKLSNECNVVAFYMHHIIMDGWSIRILYNELSALYSALINNITFQLEDLPIQFTDFAIRQKRISNTEKISKQLEYWKGKLSNYPIVHPLTLDFNRPLEQKFEGERINFEIDATLFKSLNEISRQEKSTLNMVLLSAFSVLIYRYGNSGDLIIGSPIANRNEKDIESLIGFFVNTLALRINVLEDISFRELLLQIKNTIIEASDNQDVTFDRIVEELQPDRRLNHNPIFQITFAYHNLLKSNFVLEGAKTEQLFFNKYDTANDLEVHLRNSSDGIFGFMLYNISIFKKETIEQLIAHYINILRNISYGTNQKVGEIQILSENERHQILHDFNFNVTDYPQNNCVCELIEEIVNKFPDNNAIVFENKKITYKELNNCANHLAIRLREKGVKANSVVGICLERSIDLIVGLVGIIKSGAAYLPIDVSTPTERINFILKDSNVEYLVVRNESSLELQDVEKIGIDQFRVLPDINNPEIINKLNDLFYIIYTSGTTGTPKGVPIKYLGYLNLINNFQRIFNMTSESKFSQISTIGFDAMCLEVWPCLISGASLYIIDENTKYNSAKIKQFIIENDITHSFLPTVYAEELISEKWPSTVSLKYLLTGGDRLKKFSNPSHPFKFYNLYGPTEDTVFSTYKEVKEKQEYEITQFPTIGKPLTNKKLYVLNQKNNIVPIGVAGELCISGIGLSGRYHNNEELSKEKFINNPFEDGAILYKTGDLAKWLPNSEIEILGRIDNQVKINGIRIELEEIEQCLQHYDGIKEASVLIKENSSGIKNLYAFYVSDEQLNSSELNEYLQKKVPNYMIPRFFTRIEKLPLTPSGKVNKKALSEFNVQSLLKNNENYEPPKNNFEKIFIDIWKELLNLQSVGVNDNFFDVGGHSLLIAKLVSLTNEKAGVEIEVVDVFRYPTIRLISNNLVSKSSNININEVRNTQESRIKNLRKIVGNRKI